MVPRDNDQPSGFGSTVPQFYHGWYKPSTHLGALFCCFTSISLIIDHWSLIMFRILGKYLKYHHFAEFNAFKLLSSPQILAAQTISKYFVISGIFGKNNLFQSLPPQMPWLSSVHPEAAIPVTPAGWTGTVANKPIRVNVQHSFPLLTWDDYLWLWLSHYCDKLTHQTIVGQIPLPSSKLT